MKQPENRFLCFFHFGAIWALPNGPKKIPKSLQMGKTKLENKPLTKLFGSFLSEKLSETTRKQVFMLFISLLGPFGHPQMDPKRYPNAPNWAGGMAQFLGLKISP
jgi:hypothetical protein